MTHSFKISEHKELNTISGQLELKYYYRKKEEYQSRKRHRTYQFQKLLRIVINVGLKIYNTIRHNGAAVTSCML